MNITISNVSIYEDPFSCDQVSTYGKVYYMSIGCGFLMTIIAILQYIICIINKFSNIYDCIHYCVIVVLCKLLNWIAYFVTILMSLGSVGYLSNMYSCSNNNDMNLVLTALLLLFFDITILVISCTTCFEHIPIIAYIIFACIQVIIRLAILCMLCIAPLHDLTLDQIFVDIAYIFCGMYVYIYTMNMIKNNDN